MKPEQKELVSEQKTNPVQFNGLLNARRTGFDVDYVLDAVRRVENRPELRVAAYIRVSTDLQDQENSYITQEQYFRQMITHNPNWKFVGIYSDYGLSGTGTAERIGFRRLIRHCEEGRIDRIVCKSISRFARNTADFSRTMLLLRSWHITILFEKENLDSAEMQNEFILSVLGAFAQEESRSISSNVRDGIRMNMSQGNAPNVAMYGYCYTQNWLCAENGYEYREIGIVPEEARIVRMIFESVAEGRSFAEIARTLNAQGIPAPDSSYHRARRKYSRKGQLNSDLEDGWKAARIARIVRNERYAGDVLTQKTFVSDYLTHKVRVNKGEIHQYYIRDHHPAIVDRLLYEKVQRILEKRTRRPSRNDRKMESPFANRMICGQCGRFYGAFTKDGTNRWHCPTAAQDNGMHLCQAVDIAEETLCFALCEAICRDYGLARTMFLAHQDAGEARSAAERNARKTARALFRSIQQRLEKILNDDYVERERSFYKGQLAEMEETLEQDAAERLRTEKGERAESQKTHETTEKRYNEVAKKLHALEEYWKELECDHALRGKALQWVRALPQSKQGLRDFLQGMTGNYFRAFVLDMTIFSSERYQIRWFDDRVTEVELKNHAKEEASDG